MVACSKCIRSYHVKCLKANQLVADMAEWTCPECVDVEAGETKEKG
jgi:PHD-finger